ncbi:MAG: universal stress protein [Anaerolineales bacterium]|jgi:nucleotide-binding universal stress UspA family protein
MATENQLPIRHVACAVRGRLANRNAVRHAIRLALDNDARLTFFLVISGDFLGSASPTMSPTKTLYDRLTEIGEYILMLLSERAVERGVSEVEHEVRIGDVRTNLRAFAKKTTAQILVMGRPSGVEPRSLFTPEEFSSFVEELESISELKVDVVEPELNQD